MSSDKKMSLEQCLVSSYISLKFEFFVIFQKWQDTFLSIDCDKLGKKEKENYFKMKCDDPLFLCGEMSSKSL